MKHLRFKILLTALFALLLPIAIVPFTAFAGEIATIGGYAYHYESCPLTEIPHIMSEVDANCIYNSVDHSQNLAALSRMLGGNGLYYHYDAATDYCFYIYSDGIRNSDPKADAISIWQYLSGIQTIIYTIEYNLDDGALASGVTNPATYTVEDNAITLNAPEKAGYTFTGWTGTDLSEATKDVTIAKNSTGNRSYKANWEIIEYTLTYDLAQGELENGATNPDKYTVESDAFILVNPVRTGYDFIGWTGTDLTEATKDVTVNKGSIGDRSYTANWEPHKYTITYDLQGGQIPNNQQNPETYTTEDKYFSLINPEKEGYEFVGWTGTELGDPETYVIINNGTIGDRTYTANWKPIEKAAAAAPAETDPAETEPTETEPVETEPVETEPEETEPEETEPEETEPEETEPAKTEPAETEPAESTPAETEPTETDPVFNPDLNNKTAGERTSPQTADPTNVILWTILLLSAGIVLTGTVLLGKVKTK